MTNLNHAPSPTVAPTATTPAPEIQLSEPATDQMAEHAGKRAPVLAEWIICGVIALIAAVIMAQMLSLGLGTISEPEAGLWPIIIASIVLVAVPFAIFDKTISEPYHATSMVRSALMAVALLVFLPLYPLLGFVLAAFLMMFVIIRWVCHESLLSSLMVSITTPLIAYLLFGVLFQVAINPLPSWLGL